MTVVAQSFARRQSLAQGFTLLELLIAISLLSLLMLGLGSTLMTVAQTQTKADARLQLLDQQRVTVRFLRTIFAQTSATPNREGVMVEGRRANYFLGDGQVVQWLGVMPARFGAGGRTHFKLGLEPSAAHGGHDLVLRYLPWSSEQTQLDWGQATGQILETKVQALQLFYQDGAQGAHVWHSNWQSAELPSAIDMQVSTDTGRWHRTTMAIYATPASAKGSSNGGAVFGGTAQ